MTPPLKRVIESIQSRSRRPSEDLPSAAWKGLEEILEQFEDAWARGERPVLEEYLKRISDAAARRALLIELVHEDLEYRLKAGEAARVEDYLVRCPELTGEEGALLDLLRAEYALRRGSGQQVTPEEYPWRFPQLRAALASWLPSEPSGVSSSAGTVADPSATPTPPPPGSARTLPTRSDAGHLRYRPLRFHAKGGLGEIQVAEDRELHREVALKRIQAQHAHDAESRQRFLREAEITARLEHPGVVPVHGLVHDADDQPCYAMRFIQGETLQEALECFHAADGPKRDPGERSLAFRQLLSRFLVVCNTIAYAHSRGVIHRDLKPANIMLGPYGETLVVDWGLAKVQGRPEEVAGADAAITQSSSAEGVPSTQAGAVLGSPAYMSPEQASGRTEQVGPASDLFGLGAMLYALLTGKGPFEGNDVFEILVKARESHFPRPRQVKAGIPAALEAVCLKAMAVQPADRYATAQALAADVEHWLADEPVAAYREPWHTRLRRWGRRHRPLVAGTTALLLTALVAVLVGLVVVDRERRRAERERDRADANLQLARTAVDQAFTGIAENKKLKEADFHDLRKQLLKAVVPFYEQFVAQQQDDPELRAARGTAYGRLGLIRYELGEMQQAVTDYEQMREIFTGLAAQHSAVPQYRHYLAGSHSDLGAQLGNMGKHTEAAAAYRAAIKLQEELAAQHPDRPQYRRSLAKSQNGLGVVLKDLGKGTEAAAAYRAAVKLLEELVAQHPDRPQYRQDLATSQNDLGNLLQKLSQYGEAEAAYREALKLQRQLADDFPRVPEYRRDLARSHLNLGVLLYQLDKRAEAEAAYRAALKLNLELAVQHPAVPKYRQELALSHNNLGALLKKLDKHAEAEVASRAALKLQEELAAQHPDLPQYRRELAASHNNLGSLLHALGNRIEAETAYREARKLQQQLAADSPKVPQYRQDLAASHNNLGNLLRDLDKLGEAETAYREAHKLQQQLVDDFPNISAYQNNLALTLTSLATVLVQKGEHAQAVAELAPVLAAKEVSAAVLYDAGCVYALSVAAVHKDDKLATAEQEKQAEAYGRQAIVLLRQAVAKGYRDTAHLGEDKDLDPLRSRADFKKLLAELESTNPAKESPSKK